MKECISLSLSPRLFLRNGVERNGMGLEERERETDGVQRLG